MDYKEALELATIMHKGQKRKITGEDYIVHPIAVADKFFTRDYKIVSVLHDTIEDTNLTFEKLKKYGLDKKLIIVLDFLTHYPNESYLSYLLKLKDNKMARIIKIEDLKHNLINPVTKCQEDKYKMALYILRNDLNGS